MIVFQVDGLGNVENVSKIIGQVRHLTFKVPVDVVGFGMVANVVT